MTYQRVDRDSRRLLRRLRATPPAVGRPPKNSLSPAGARAEVIKLLERCTQYGLPPPDSLTSLIRRSFELLPPGERRPDHASKTLAIEEEARGRGLEWTLVGGLVFKAKLASVAGEAGKSERTIRNWRASDDEYRRLALGMITAQISEKIDVLHAADEEAKKAKKEKQFE